jgi:hypothetical protein
MNVSVNRSAGINVGIPAFLLADNEDAPQSAAGTFFQPAFNVIAAGDAPGVNMLFFSCHIKHPFYIKNKPLLTVCI